MTQPRNLPLALTALSLFALSCSLLGQVASEVGDQVSKTVEEQLQNALEAAGREDLSEQLSDMMDQVSEDNIAELIEDFTDGEWRRSDIPLPPDAEIFGAYSGELDGEFALLETGMNLEETEAWMIARLGENGWTQADTEFSAANTRVYKFSKGNEQLGLVMNGSEDSGKTTISITVVTAD